MRLHINRITAIIFFTIIIFTSLLNAQVNNATSTVSTSNDNSVLISYDIPEKLKPGEEYIVNITMLNSAKSKWKKSDNYRLALYDEFDNKYQTNVWGINNVTLPYDVNPGEKVIFYFKITAPQQGGTYNCNWIMKNDSAYFGDYTAALIKIDGGSGDDYLSNDGIRSEFITLSIPSNMISGEKYKVSITMKNTGTQPWYSAAGGDYKIAPVTDSSTTLHPEWNSSPVYLSNTVDTGQTSAIEFEVTAPPTPGKQSLQWMMKKGDYFFGQKTSKVIVNVSRSSKKGSDPRENNSTFVEQNIPISMIVNEDHNVSITMRNTGNKTWIKGKEQLVMVDTDKKLITLNSWGVGYIQLPDNIEPGKEVTFKFKVRPRDTGWQYFQMIMMNEDGTIFGDATQSVEIIVSKR